MHTGSYRSKGCTSILMEQYEPPVAPPALLTGDELITFAHQGHLKFALKYELALRLQETLQAATTFFEQQDLIKVARYPAAYGTELGYHLLSGEKEYLTFRWLPKITEDSLEIAIKDVWGDVAVVLYRVLVDLSCAMSISLEAWDPLLDGCLEIPSDEQDITPTLLRIFNYFPISGGAGEHSDNGLLTLCVSAEPGLQVFDYDRTGQSGQWRDVQGATLLAGSMLQVLSGNRVRAGLHRVVGSADGRNSIVFALRPSLRCPWVDLSTFGGEGVKDIRETYNTIKARRHNVNAPKETRDQQKRSNARTRA